MTTIKIKKGAGTPSGLTFGELAYDLTNKKLFIGITGGNALLANTDGGVSQVNGATGSVTTYAGTTGNIQFRYGSGITATNYFDLAEGWLSQITDVLTLSGPTSADWWFGGQQAIGLQIQRLFDGLGLDEGGGVSIKALGIGGEDVLYGSTLRIETPSAPQGSNIYFQAGGAEQFIIFQNEVVSVAKHGFYNGINSTTTAGNTFEGPITGVTASFTGLLSASKGISAAGGATFSGDIAVNGGDITTTSATATVFNTTATNLSIGSAATSLTMGAASGIATIRNPILYIGTTAGLNYIITPESASSHLFIQPYGNLYLAPSTNAAYIGSLASLSVNNTSAAAGLVSIYGGDLFLGYKTTNDEDYLPVNIIFEGASGEDPPQTTTLTVVDPTANRTITLPDASGTVALTSGVVTRVNGFTGGITFAASTGITFTASAGTITLSTTGGGGSKTYAVYTPLDNQPPAANYATIDTRNSIMVLDFDAATDESAVFVGIIPEAASLGSGLKIRINWMATSATSGTCRWGVQIERMNTDEDSDSFNTAATAGSTTNATSGIITTTEITITTIDSVAAGDPFRIKVYRDADGTSGTDDMTGDAELVSVEVRSAA